PIALNLLRSSTGNKQPVWKPYFCPQDKIHQVTAPAVARIARLREIHLMSQWSRVTWGGTSERCGAAKFFGAVVTGAGVGSLRGMSAGVLPAGATFGTAGTGAVARFGVEGS